MTIDFAKIMARPIAHKPMNQPMSQAEAALAAKVPDLCPDCHGSDVRPAKAECGEGETNYAIRCHHPNAPTIAKLLAIGAAVMPLVRPRSLDVLKRMERRGEEAGHFTVTLSPSVVQCVIDELTTLADLAELRAVEP
jgi:hypothetical protein